MIILPFKLDPGAVVPVAGYGKFVYFESASGTGDTSIVVKAQGGSGIDYVLKVGQGFRTPDVYTQLIISNRKNEGVINGVLVIADDGFFDNRVVGTVDISGVVSVTGTVAVVDGGKSRSAGGTAFIGMAQCQAGGAASGNIQLWNPAANTKNVIMSRFTMSVTTGTTTLRGYITASQLAVYLGNGSAKKPGLAAASAELRAQSANTAFTTQVMGYDVVVNTPYTYVTSEPIILAPGYGLTLRNIQATSDITATFEWIEE